MKHFLLFTLIAFFMGTVQRGFSQVTITNADFENGTNGWTAKFQNGSAGTFSATPDAHGGSQAVLIDVTTADPTSNITKVNVTSDKITSDVTDRASYKLSAYMKSDAAENGLKWKMVAYDSGDNKRHMNIGVNDDGTTHQLSTEYKKYQWILNTNYIGFDQGFDMIFQAGLYVAKYYIDDITMEKLDNIENGDFEDDENLFGFSTTVGSEASSASFSIEESDVNGGAKSLKVDVTQSNDTASSVTVVSDVRYYPEMGKKYEYSFYAKSTGSNDSISLDVNFYNATNGFVSMQSKMVKLSNTYEKYSVEFELPDDSITSTKFRIGLGKQVSTVYADDLKVTLLPPVSAKEFKLDNFRCYPNPATTKLNISGASMGTDVDIINIAGVVIKSLKVNSDPMAINVNDMMHGVYLIRSEGNIRKFIKK